MIDQKSFFKDLLVIELASVLAGPAVGMFFAEMGAQVIKIENKKTGGDVTRNWKTKGEDPKATFSSYYQQVNYGKQSLLLDLKDPKDQTHALELIAMADVVISNFRPDKADQMGMGEAQLRGLNPKLIFAHLSAFGYESKRPAFDVVLQAEAGFMFMTGHADRPPAKMPVALIDLLAAHQLKEGILIGIIHRIHTGAGCSVKVSLLDAALASLANQASNWFVAGHIPQRMGSEHPNIAPYGDIFTCREDKPIVVAAGTQRHFERLCATLQCPDLIRDARFADNAARVNHRPELQSTLAPYFHKEEREELLQKLETAGVPAGAIRSMPEVFELPQAQELIRKYDLPGGGEGTCLQNGIFRLS